MLSFFFFFFFLSVDVQSACYLVPGFFSLFGLYYNPPLYNIEVGVFRHLFDNFFLRFAMEMISDDGGKTPLITFCGFYQFHSWGCWHWNVLGLCSRGRNRALRLDQHKKSRAENAKVGFNPTFAFSAAVSLTRWRQNAGLASGSR